MKRNKRKMKNKLAIKFLKDGRVEITIDKPVLDQRRLAKFPESLDEITPPYTPKLPEQMIKIRQQNPNQGPVYMLVDHEMWCPELEGKGRCNCNPNIIDLELGENTGMGHEKLICKECGQFSTGKMILHDVVENDMGCWDRFWIAGGDISYWLVGILESANRLLICHQCMLHLGIEFPNAIENGEASRDHKLH
jgi:hypothetical protein